MKRISYCLVLLAAAVVGIVVAETETKPQAKPLPKNAKVIFLHHSTGQNVWNGGVEEWFTAYNAKHGTSYSIIEQAFPKESPYGWENYPYDYWNIWVKHAGPKAYKQEPTLEMLTKDYDVIVLKHCFPVSNVEADNGEADVASPDKRIENYKLQYEALKKKMHEFPDARFIVWTGAAQTKDNVDEDSAKRAKEFFTWVKDQWDEKGDNIYVWDFYTLETEGDVYLKHKHSSDGDSHPNEVFCKQVAPMLGRRITDVIEGRGDGGDIMGKETK